MPQPHFEDGTAYRAFRPTCPNGQILVAALNGKLMACAGGLATLTTMR